MALSIIFLRKLLNRVKMQANKSNLTRTLTIALTVLGCFQTIGYIFDSQFFRGIGFSYGVSPRPTVFGTVQGVEGFDTSHSLRYINQQGDTVTVTLDKNHFSNLQGAYLKNTYSIFLAYPHVLKPEMVQEGGNYLLCGQHMEQFGITDINQSLSIESHKKVLGTPAYSILNSTCENE